MDFFLKEDKIDIVYWPSERFYGIGSKRGTSSAQLIHYCPWCSTKLPKDLNDELCKIIFDELKLDDFDDPRMPEEFKTDEWWKKRGL